MIILPFFPPKLDILPLPDMPRSSVHKTHIHQRARLDVCIKQICGMRKWAHGERKFEAQGGESYRRCRQSWSACHRGCYVRLESITLGKMVYRCHYGNRIRKYRQCCPKVDRVALSTHINGNFVQVKKKKKKIFKTSERWRDMPGSTSYAVLDWND